MSAVFLLGIAVRTDAAVINASSASLAAVQAAVNSASAGDTIQVPAGTATWAGALTITKDIQLIGAGIGQTIIIDEVPRVGGHASILFWTTVANGYCRLSGFSFQGGTINTTVTADGELDVGGKCSAFRADHLELDHVCAQAFFIHGAVFGVIDDCNFYQTNWANGIEVENGGIGGDTGHSGEGNGDVSWATPVQWGTTNNFLYIETCTFTYPAYNYEFVDDACRGSRLVFRYNYCSNMQFQTHGTESSQRLRGARAYEIYMNTWTNPAAGYKAGQMAELRSGTGVIFSNTISGLGCLISPQTFRSLEIHPPWGSANGLNAWDSNNIAAGVVATGTHTGTAGANRLVDSTKNWTQNQFIPGYVIQDITQGGTNTATYGLVSANGANNINTTQGDAQIAWQPGDTYKIYKMSYVLDQLGLGSGDLVQDTYSGSDIPINTVTHSQSWPHEASEPLYMWGNTLNGAANFAQGSNIGSYNFNIVQLNRDYYDNTVKPGYTPLVYPHPLVTGIPAPPTYTLTVVNGNGSGSYAAGSVITISPGTISGKYFTNWSGLNIANTNAATTTVTMPAANLTVTANFANSSPSTYTLTVVNGSGGGTYTSGSVVSISANLILTEFFTNWSGLFIANTNTANTTVTMPASSLTVTANYAPYPPTQLKIMGGL